MFGLSIAIIFPMVLLVIYTTRVSIAKVVLRMEKRLFGWKWWNNLAWQRKRQGWVRRSEDKDGEYASSSGVEEEKEEALKRVPFWRRGVGQEEVSTDAEMGTNGKEAR